MKELTFNRPSEPEEEPIAKPQKRSVGSKAAPTMRTYGRDVEGLLKEERITKTQVVMAEEERRESRGEVRTTHDDDSSHLTIIIIVLVFVLALGLGVGAYVLIGTTPTQEAEGGGAAQAEKTERMLEIDITGSPREQILADTAVAYSKTTFTPNESRVIAFTIIGQDKKIRDATSLELLTALAATNIPEALLRSVLPGVTLTVEGRTISDPLIGYLALTSRSYANSAASMLEWEGAMANDLIPLLDPKFKRTRLAELYGRPWSDMRVSGIDTRIMKDADNQVVIAYAFIDKTRIIIAGNEMVLGSVISRTQAGKNQ